MNTFIQIIATYFNYLFVNFILTLKNEPSKKNKLNRILVKLLMALTQIEEVIKLILVVEYFTI